MVVCSCSGEARQLLVLGSQAGEELPYLELALGFRQVVVFFQAHLFGHFGVQFVDRFYADVLKHALYVGLCMGEILVHS